MKISYQIDNEGVVVATVLSREPIITDGGFVLNTNLGIVGKVYDQVRKEAYEIELTSEGDYKKSDGKLVLKKIEMKTKTIPL